jgi:hypothetical protein
MVGLLGYGYGAGDGKVSALRDMFNGGGRGTAGDKFEGGGGYSGILNMLGIKPKDYADRHAMMGNGLGAQVLQQSPLAQATEFNVEKAFGGPANNGAVDRVAAQTGNPAMAQTPWNATQAGPQDFYNMPQNNPAMAGGTAPAAQAAQDPAYMSFLSGLPAGTLQNNPEFLRKLYEMGQNHTPTFMPPPSGVMR